MDINWLDDARKIPDEVMCYIRVLAVVIIRERGYSPELVAEMFKIHRTSIYHWLKLYDDGGYEALRTLVAPGAPAVITEEMDEWMVKVVLTCTPTDFEYDTNLWTCGILAALIESKFQVKVSDSTIGLHLKKLGLSCQKPEYRDAKRDPAEIEHFLKDKVPMIHRLRERMDAEIGFEDEAGVGVMTRSGKTWGMVGKTPIIPVSMQRGGYNVLSIVTAAGELEYSIKENTITAKEYVEFLEKLILNRKRPLILLVDRASFHRAKLVRKFVALHRKQLRIFFLPKRAPEFNPDEQVWNHIKNEEIGKQPVKNKSDLKERLVAALESLKSNAKRVMSFCGMPNTQYAGSM